MKEILAFLPFYIKITKKGVDLVSVARAMDVKLRTLGSAVWFYIVIFFHNELYFP